MGVPRVLVCLIVATLLLNALGSTATACTIGSKQIDLCIAHPANCNIHVAKSPNEFDLTTLSALPKNVQEAWYTVSANNYNFTNFSQIDVYPHGEDISLKAAAVDDQKETVLEIRVYWCK